jgi:hypothetical protein
MEVSLLRRAAIRLACTHAEDREWVLAQLDTDERLQIEELLQEINLLGLAADPAIVASLIAETSSQANELSLTASDAAVRASVVRAEHPFWAGLALQLNTQAQKRAVIDALPDAQRVKRWDNAFTQQSVPPALALCLCNHLSRSEVRDDDA